MYGSYDLLTRQSIQLRRQPSKSRTEMNSELFQSEFKKKSLLFFREMEVEENENVKQHIKFFASFSELLQAFLIF